jgi:hypothetical protein
MNPMSLQNLANFAMSIFVAIVELLREALGLGPAITDTAPARRVHDEPLHGWVMIRKKRWHADDADSSADKRG